MCHVCLGCHVFCVVDVGERRDEFDGFRVPNNTPEHHDHIELTPAGPGWTLTTGQIAGYCRVHYRTVLRWIKAGRLKAHQLPGRGDHRVEVPNFLSFLSENRLPIPIEFINTSKRILIVDDDPAMAAGVQRVLKRAGYETKIAPNGFQAGAMLGYFKPELVVLDLRMPGIGGLDVLWFIRERPETLGVKVMILSAQPQEEIQSAINAGADDGIQKPFINEHLVDVVRRLLNEPPRSHTG